MIEISSNLIDLSKIASSGQCFRLNGIGGSHFLLTAMSRILRISQKDDGKAVFYCSPDEYEGIWKDYFDLGEDYSAFEEAIPEEDEFLRRAAAFSKGIRILRQDPWEMLITFIISQRKSIPAIRGCVNALCNLLGEDIESDEGVKLREDVELGKNIDFSVKDFPTPVAIAEAGEGLLSSCSLGYRTSYVHKSAILVASEEKNLGDMANLEDEELRSSLLEFPGVGPKVANCIMLFGFHRIAAFPVDVWIERIIDAEYGGEFPLELYEGFAGIMQQYMFYYGRAMAGVRS